MKFVFFAIKETVNSIMNFIKKILLGMINFYRKYISPIKGVKHCKYIPTCSEYAVEAIEKYGPLKGSFLAVKRILRCNPFSKGGYDPVP